MKVISILQPWATLVVIGAKKIETRSWDTKFRGPLLIHASKRWDNRLYNSILDIGAEYVLEKAGYKLTKIKNGKIFTNLPLGAVIGKVDVFGCMPSDTLLHNMDLEKRECRAAEFEERFGDYSPGRYGWLLSDAVEFANPIPAKGALSIWNYDLPDHFHLPVKGGIATFDLPPTKETMEAVNKMADLAYKIKIES